MYNLAKCFLAFGALVCLTIGSAEARQPGPLPKSKQSDPALVGVKRRVIDFWVGGSGDGRYRRQAIMQQDAWVGEALSRPFEPLVWEDSARLVMNVRLNSLAGDLRRMAVAYRAQHSRYYEDGAVKRRIIAGLDNILQFFNPTAPRPGNWYQWLIGLPGNLGATALLMQPELPEKMQRSLINALSSELTERLILTGSNAVAEGRNHICLALLQGDTARLRRGAEYVFRTVRFGIAQGVREDYCYLFHGRLPYAGAYGAGYAQTIAESIYLFDGTPWAIEEQHRSLIADLLLDHTRWFFSGDKVDMLVRGRGYGRQSNGSAELKALLVMAQVEGPRKTEAAESAAGLLTDASRSDLDLSSAGLADRLKGLEGGLPHGFRYWPSGEIAAFNQPAFHIGLRQYSSRVQDYEYLMRSDGGEGGAGWNLAFGFTHIMRTDGRGSWYDTANDRMLAAVDMEHLPGTTTRVGGHPQNPLFVYDPHKLTMSTSGYSLNFGKSDLAGGAGWKEGGMAGFVLIPRFGDFSAKKSVFFFPGGFWALGSDITATAGVEDAGNHRIETTVLQWPYRDSRPAIVLEKGTLIPGGDTLMVSERIRWMWLRGENVAVVFDKPTRVHLRLKDRMLTVWLDHGTHPVSAGYAYAVLPDISLAATRDFAADMPVRPRRCDGKVHAVAGRTGGRSGVVFFEPDSCLGVTTHSPLVVYREARPGGGILTVQDPLHQTKKIQFEIQGITAPVREGDSAIRVTPLASGQTEVEVATLLGRIYRLGYGTQAFAATPVPRQNLDISCYQDFRVEALSDSSETILTVHLPDEALADGYRLSVHFIKSQRLHDFSEKDIIDRPSANTVRYRWVRKPADGPRVFSQYLRTRHGRFSVYLVTPWIETSDSFSVPEFGAP